MAATLPAGYKLVDDAEEPQGTPALPSGYKLVDEPKEQSIANFAKGLATEVAVGGAGQALGALTGPGYFVIAPASGAYGNYLKQQQEIERGERPELSWGEMVASALINTIPGGAATKVGAKVLKPATELAGKTIGKTAAQIGEQAAIRATEGAVVGAGAKTVETAIEDKRWPTYDEYLGVVKSGGALGGAIGAGEKVVGPALSKGASKMWNRLSGKTQQEVAQELTTIRNTGTSEERQAAGEIIDEVGQRMGLVNPRPKSAEEAGRVFAAEQPTFVMRSTGGRAEAVPSGFGSEGAETAAGLAPARTRAPELSALEAGSDMPPLSARTAGQAEEAARALVGEQAVEMAKRQAPILTAQEQAALRARQAVEQARLQAEAQAQAAASIRGGFGGEGAMAGSQPAPVGAIPGTTVSPRPVGGFGGSGIEGTPVGYPRSAAESALAFQNAVAAESPQAAAVFERAIAEGQTQAGAQGLRARLAAEQQASIRAGDFQRARGLEDIGRQIEARRLTSPEQVPSEAALRSSMVKPAGKVGRLMGTDMPTTEDIIQEFQNVPGVKGRAGARELGLAGAGASVAAGVAEAMQDDSGAKFSAPIDSYEIVHPDPRLGTLRYNAKDWNEDSILRDINKKELELVKIDAAAPQLMIREKWQQIEDARDRGEITEIEASAQQMQLMKDTPISEIGLATAARIGFPIAGEALTRKRGGGMIGRVGGSMIGEAVGSAIEGEPITGGKILQAGIASLPAGKEGQLVKNLLKFAGANVAGEMTKEAMDRNDLLSFKNASIAAAEGGAGALSMKLMEKATRALSSQATKRGEWAVIKTLTGANELGLIVDPTIYQDALPKAALMKVAGGSTKFQEAASRINYPRMTEAVESVLGAPAGTSFDRAFFLQEKIKLGKPYEKVAAVSKKAENALDDWKVANETMSVNAAAAGAEKNPKARLEFREAARKAKDDAEKAFAVIQTEAYATGNGHLVKDLQDARRQYARLYAIKSAVNEASGKIENPAAWGVMYEAGVPFDGKMEKLARLSAIMPEVLQPPQMMIRERPLKGVSDTKIVEGISNMMRLPFKAGMALPQEAALRTMMSPAYQRGSIIPSSMSQPSIPAQLGRFMGTETMQAARPVPYR
jgi:hypothetical protein